LTIGGFHMINLGKDGSFIGVSGFFCTALTSGVL
jgi:hypothetical protein